MLAAITCVDAYRLLQEVLPRTISEIAAGRSPRRLSSDFAVTSLKNVSARWLHLKIADYLRLAPKGLQRSNVTKLKAMDCAVDIQNFTVCVQ